MFEKSNLKNHEGERSKVVSLLFEQQEKFFHWVGLFEECT